MSKVSNIGIIFVLIIMGVVLYSVISYKSTSTVTKTTDKAINMAYVSSANNLINAAKFYYTNTLLDGADMKEFDGKTNLLDKLKVSGSMPNLGIVYMNENEDIYIGVIYEDVCYSKDFKEDTVTVKEIKFCK